MNGQSQRQVDVILVGTAHYRTCASCNSGRTMAEMAMLLRKRLDLQFGSQVNYRYIDATTDVLKDLGPFAEQISSGKIPLPVTLIDGEPLFPGMYTPTMIIYQIKRKLRFPGVSQSKGKIWGGN